MLLLVAALMSTAVIEEPDLTALVDRIEHHYDALTGFQADFTQSYERRLIRKTIVESGRVTVKKPGRMRWEYLSPEAKLFVTDGSRSYFYLPMEKQVMVSHNPQGAMGLEKGSPFELLAGGSRLSESFTFFRSSTEPARGGVMLRLVPNAHHEEFDEVEVEVDPQSGELLRVLLMDAQRNRTVFTFDNLRRDTEIPESLFRFTIPSGVEVVVHSDDP